MTERIADLGRPVRALFVLAIVGVYLDSLSTYIGVTTGNAREKQSQVAWLIGHIGLPGALVVFAFVIGAVVLGLALVTNDLRTRLPDAYPLGLVMLAAVVLTRYAVVAGNAMLVLRGLGRTHG
jgi:hypothetical protein